MKNSKHKYTYILSLKNPKKIVSFIFISCYFLFVCFFISFFSHIYCLHTFCMLSISISIFIVRIHQNTQMKCKREKKMKQQTPEQSNIYAPSFSILQIYLHTYSVYAGRACVYRHSFGNGTMCAFDTKSLELNARAKSPSRKICQTYRAIHKVVQCTEQCVAAIIFIDYGILK